jgi:hypothetical protein
MTSPVETKKSTFGSAAMRATRRPPYPLRSHAPPFMSPNTTKVNGPVSLSVRLRSAAPRSGALAVSSAGASACTAASFGRGWPSLPLHAAATKHAPPVSTVANRKRAAVMTLIVHLSLARPESQLPSVGALQVQGAHRWFGGGPDRHLAEDIRHSYDRGCGQLPSDGDPANTSLDYPRSGTRTELARNPSEALAQTWSPRLGEVNGALETAFKERNDTVSCLGPLQTSVVLLIDDVNREIDRLEGDLKKLFPGQPDRVASYLAATRPSRPTASELVPPAPPPAPVAPS